MHHGLGQDSLTMGWGLLLATNLHLKWVVAHLAAPRSGRPDPEEEALPVDVLDRPLAPARGDEWGAIRLCVATVANLEHVQWGCKMAQKNQFC